VTVKNAPAAEHIRVYHAYYDGDTAAGFITDAPTRTEAHRQAEANTQNARLTRLTGPFTVAESLAIHMAERAIC